MKGKYLKHMNYWTMQVNNNYLVAMKHMLRNKDIAVRLMNRVIVDGAKISLLFDRCINHKILVELLGWHRISMFSTTPNIIATSTSSTVAGFTI